MASKALEPLMKDLIMANGFDDTPEIKIGRGAKKKSPAWTGGCKFGAAYNPGIADLRQSLAVMDLIWPR